MHLRLCAGPQAAKFQEGEAGPEDNSTKKDISTKQQDPICLQKSEGYILL